MKTIRIWIKCAFQSRTLLICLIFILVIPIGCSPERANYKVIVPPELLQGDTVIIGGDFNSVKIRRRLEENSSTGIWFERGSPNGIFSEAEYVQRDNKLDSFGFYKLDDNIDSAATREARLIQVLDANFGPHTVIDDSSYLGSHPSLAWRAGDEVVAILNYSRLLQSSGIDTVKQSVHVLRCEIKKTSTRIAASTKFTDIEWPKAE